MAATDTFDAFQIGLDAPAESAAAVSPSDSTELTNVSRALWIGAGSGGLHVLMADGSEVTFAGIPVGTLLPIRVRKVFNASTTASSIVALW